MLYSVPAPASKMARPSAGLVSRWDHVNGYRIHARISETNAAKGRPPIVLVHGLSMSSRYMVPIARQLAANYNVYAPDLPGFGKSARPAYALGIAELADALAAWMDATGLKRAALLGNSFGCQLIVELALRHPQRVMRAILVAPTADPQARTALQQSARTLLDMLREPLSLIPIALRDYVLAGPRRTWQTLQYILHDAIEEKLPHVSVPTLVVHGERDIIVPRRWAEEATRLLPLGRLAMIPKAAHAVNYSHPAELARVTRAFLNE